jgi:hypothetical protein
MPRALWARVTPAVLTALAPIPGGHMVMATSAKKHLTVFTRSRRAKGAGRLEVKEAFRRAAHGTLGVASRAERNMRIRDAVKGAGLKTGVLHKKSRARPGSPLYGHVYTLGGGGAAAPAA